ncbi:hypothetical protein [Flavobacterium sp. UBA7682]|uniref:hypothetical protein n=1 Tax=Flavobacterium sp. UBA7682 TaxID=1946560 RepID=UPI0025C2FDEF|nr:hypothetical protein [Flavobacterium sp. UBA7682]
MCWNKVESQCKMVYSTPFINAEKPLDRKFIIQIIAEEFPDFPRVRIAATVDSCFKLFPTPVSRQKLLHFVQMNLR